MTKNKNTTSHNRSSEPSYVAHFISMALPAARNVKARWGVPVAVTLAQSAQESGWGRHVVDNAYFGVKGKAPSGTSTTFATTEVVNGRVIHTAAKFRAYKDYSEAAEDYGRLLSEKYAAAFASKDDSIKFVAAIAKMGYATDPNYAKELTAIIRSHHLDQYDK